MAVYDWMVLPVWPPKLPHFLMEIKSPWLYHMLSHTQCFIWHSGIFVVIESVILHRLWRLFVCAYLKFPSFMEDTIFGIIKLLICFKTGPHVHPGSWNRGRCQLIIPINDAIYDYKIEFRVQMCCISTKFHENWLQQNNTSFPVVHTSQRHSTRIILDFIPTLHEVVK